MHDLCRVWTPGSGSECKCVFTVLSLIRWIYSCKTIGHYMRPTNFEAVKPLSGFIPAGHYMRTNISKQCFHWLGLFRQDTVCGRIFRSSDATIWVYSCGTAGYYMWSTMCKRYATIWVYFPPPTREPSHSVMSH